MNFCRNGKARQLPASTVSVLAVCPTSYCHPGRHAHVIALSYPLETCPKSASGSGTEGRQLYLSFEFKVLQTLVAHWRL